MYLTEKLHFIRRRHFVKYLRKSGGKFIPNIIDKTMACVLYLTRGRTIGRQSSLKVQTLENPKNITLSSKLN